MRAFTYLAAAEAVHPTRSGYSLLTPNAVARICALRRIAIEVPLRHLQRIVYTLIRCVDEQRRPRPAELRSCCVLPDVLDDKVGIQLSAVHPRARRLERGPGPAARACEPQIVDIRSPARAAKGVIIIIFPPVEIPEKVLQHLWHSLSTLREKREGRAACTQFTA